MDKPREFKLDYVHFHGLNFQLYMANPINDKASIMLNKVD